jgi:hypothetical protein
MWLRFRKYCITIGEPDPGARSQDWLEGQKSSNKGGKKRSRPGPMLEPTRRSSRLALSFGEPRVFRLVEEITAADNRAASSSSFTVCSLFLSLNPDEVFKNRVEEQVVPEHHEDVTEGRYNRCHQWTGAK